MLRVMSVLPVFSVPPHLRCEVGPLVAWFTAPPGAVVQMTESAVFTKAMAQWVAGPGYEAACARFPMGGDLTLLLDLRPMISREPAARPVLMAAGTKYLFQFAKVGIIPPASPPPLYMTTLHGAVALLSAVGPEIRLYSTLEAAQQRLDLRPASP